MSKMVYIFCSLWDFVSLYFTVLRGHFLNTISQIILTIVRFFPVRFSFPQTLNGIYSDRTCMNVELHFVLSQ